MNSRIRKKLEKDGRLLKKEALWAPQFDKEEYIIGLYNELRERDPAHPLLAYGSIDAQDHFQPSVEHWEDYALTTTSYMLKLRIAARAIQELEELGKSSIELPLSEEERDLLFSIDLGLIEDRGRDTDEYRTRYPELGASLGLQCRYRSKVHNGMHVIYDKTDGTIVECIVPADTECLTKERMMRRLHEINGMGYSLERDVVEALDKQE